VGGCAQLRWSATGGRFLGAAACEAAARSCAGRRPVCGPFPGRCCLRSGSSIWKLAGAARYLDFSPRLRPGRKTKDASRSVTCAAACLGCESMWRCSGLMPRAALCLEGHWVKMRPGAAVMAHPCRRMAVGCHRPRAQRGTSCCAVTGASSAALRGGEMFRLLAFFPRTLSEPSFPAHVFGQGFLANASLRLGRQPTLQGRRREGGWRRGSERNEKRSTTFSVRTWRSTTTTLTMTFRL